jgi:hypothetical protein
MSFLTAFQKEKQYIAKKEKTFPDKTSFCIFVQKILITS